MSATKTYFVKLTPLQLFFFGGEQGETADYFLKGSFQPQQTALLGLVRHQVLLQNNLMANNKIKNDSEAGEWIGTGSFEYNKVEQKFGKIHGLGPCYLVRKGKDGTVSKFLPFCQPYCQNVQKLGDNYYLPEFDPKGYYPDVWKSLDTGETISNKNGEIYKEVTKPGVDKNYEGQTEDGDDAYYKQVWLKMEDGFSAEAKAAYAFGFYVTLEADVNFETSHATFGKESAPFFMEVENAEEKFTKQDDPTALILNSDTYVEEGIISLTDFAVIDTVPFRNILSSTSKSTNYYKFNGKNNKSAVRLLLLKRGSVFYNKNGNLKKIKNAIDARTNFMNIGYNHYHLLKINY